jgi:DNA-binding GntR family transcriptional regulator
MLTEALILPLILYRCYMSVKRCPGMSTIEDDTFAWADALPGTPVDGAGVATGSLHDAIYADLRQALVMGDFVPGQRFSMRTLADRFQVSLIPVRDALKRLVAERGLMMMPNRTVCVPLMTRHTFQELLQVRLSLESMLARRGAELIGRKHVAALARVNDEMQAAVGRDVKQYLAANYRFHFGLYRAADSAVILPIVESLWMQIGPFLNAVFTTKGTANARDNHAEVLKALRRGDSIAVGNAIKRDLADAADVILANVEFISDNSSDEREETRRRRRHARTGKRALATTAAGDDHDAEV